MFGRAARLFAGGVPESLSSYSTLSTSYEVIIGGGGIMGCSSAFFLAQRMRPSSICIVEKDPKVRQCGVCTCTYVVCVRVWCVRVRGVCTCTWCVVRVRMWCVWCVRVCGVCTCVEDDYCS